jgi:acetyl esterase/lipase
LVHTAEDKSVPVQNSLLFATALAANGVPFSLHVYEKGQHGVGLGNDVMNKTWSDQCVLWLKARGF